MKGFSFFQRTHSNGKPTDDFVVVAYHHPDSITWRFVISYSRKSNKFFAGFCRVYRGCGFNFHARFMVPLVGSLSIRTQPHMWRKQ